MVQLMQSGSWGLRTGFLSLAEMLRSRSRPAWWLERMVFKSGLIHGQGAGKPQRLHLEPLQTERVLKPVHNMWPLK